MKYRLKDLMEQKGVSFRQTSRESGVAISTLQKVANDENVETIILDRLMNYFDCEPNDLIVHIKDKEPDSATIF